MDIISNSKFYDWNAYAMTSCGALTPRSKPRTDTILRTDRKYYFKLALFMLDYLLARFISTDEDPGLRIESFAIIKLRGVSIQS